MKLGNYNKVVHLCSFYRIVIRVYTDVSDLLFVINMLL